MVELDMYGSGETAVFPGICLLSVVHMFHCLPNSIRSLEQRLLFYSEQTLSLQNHRYPDSVRALE